MSSRFGDGITPPSPEPADRTRIFVAQTMLKRPKVAFEWLNDGNIRFCLPLDDTAMRTFDLQNAKLLRSRWFANTIGEFLVRINIDALDEVVRRAEFPEFAKQQWHTGFGLWVNHDSLHFQFHCSFLNQLFNEELRWELRGVR